MSSGDYCVGVVRNCIEVVKLRPSLHHSWGLRYTGKKSQGLAIYTSGVDIILHHCMHSNGEKYFVCLFKFSHFTETLRGNHQDIYMYCI